MVAPAAAVKTVQALRTAENAASRGGESFYTGSGRDEETGARTKGHKKGIGAIITIILILVGGGAFLGSSHTLLAPAIESLFTEVTDLGYASGTTRATFLSKYIIGGQDTVKTNWLGVTRYTKMSSTFKKRLSANGIEVEGSGNSRVLKYNGETITADEFKTRFSEDVDFREAYTSAKRGRLAGFFDKIATKFYDKLGLSRNIFSKFKQTGNEDVDSVKYKDTISERFNTGSTDVRVSDITDESDQDGNHHQKPNADNTKASGKTDMNEAKTKAQSLLNSVSAKVASFAGDAANIGCVALQVGTMISALIAANEIYQSINYFMNNTEPASKMKAGFGESAPTNSMLNYFTTPVNAEVEDPTTGNTEHVLGSPVEANGMQVVLGNAPVNQETNKYYSLERAGVALNGTGLTGVLGSAINTLTFTAASFKICNGVKAVTAIASIAVTLLTGGASSIVTTLAGVAFGTALGLAISGLLSILVPTIAKVLFTNIFETATGVVAGNLFAAGAANSNGRKFQTGGGGPSSKDAALAYNREYQTVLAMDAEIDRKNHSPFDITNKNTFLGSIAYNTLLPLGIASNTSKVSSFIRSTSSSISTIATSIGSSVFAGDGSRIASSSGSTFMTDFATEDQCPSLSSIGAVGNIYCIPITTTDVNTTDLPPDDDTYAAVISKNLDDSGKIKSGSNLDHYINYCAGRESPYGIIDQNIISSLSPSLGSGLDALVGALPIVGDVMDIIESVNNEANKKWATGLVCSNTEDNPDWEPEIKYYQRYVEDMRILDQFGISEEDSGDAADANPVIACMDEYEQLHPTDYSYEGVLSRFSGLTPENTEIALTFAEYFVYIDEYDPTSRIAINHHHIITDTSTNLIKSILVSHPYYDDHNIVDTEEPSLNPHEFVLYDDLRAITITA